MAPDPDLAERMRTALGCGAEFSEKRMMGGTCFFLHGTMAGGADRSKEGERRFMFRVGKANAGRAAEPCRDRDHVEDHVRLQPLGVLR